MQYAIVLGFVAMAVASPIVSPEATPVAAVRREAAPEPTAMPQLGGSLNTPFGTFSAGTGGIGFQPPGANNGNNNGGRPPAQSQNCGFNIVGCIYSSVSKDVQGDIYTAITDGLGLGGNRGGQPNRGGQGQPTVTIIYTTAPQAYQAYPTPQGNNPWFGNSGSNNNNGGNYNNGARNNGGGNRNNGW
ncbi:hypothetical protein EJ08DRAFT_658110 [Tothia fuscella]|uniref:Uncharacterized protein n=1 Tax=Tothia fuscella TaxID=1048955 RepID=A0A9P4U0I1_9PEZI|nr:hypothetical protein EJ08DRAFT_658110 [Tothia fuscella]